MIKTAELSRDRQDGPFIPAAPRGNTRVLPNNNGDFAQQRGICTDPALSVADNKTSRPIDGKGIHSGTNADRPRFRNPPTPFSAVSTPFSTTTRPRTRVVTGQPVTSIPS